MNRTSAVFGQFQAAKLMRKKKNIQRNKAKNFINLIKAVNTQIQRNIYTHTHQTHYNEIAENH